MTGLSDAVKTADQAYLKNWATLIYSMPSAGKTTLAGQAPNCLIIEIDRNGGAVLNNPLVPKTTRYIPIRDFKKVRDFVRALRTDPLLKEVDTIVLDTLSELQYLAQRSELKGDLLGDSWLFNQHIYSTSNFKILEIMREILDLGKDTIFLCHMKREKIGDGASAQVNILPDISEALLADIIAMVDGAFFLAKDNETRRLRLQTEPTIMTKSRFPKGATILNPTFDKLLPVLNELKKKDDQQ